LPAGAQRQAEPTHAKARALSVREESSEKAHIWV